MRNAPWISAYRPPTPPLVIPALLAGGCLLAIGVSLGPAAAIVVGVPIVGGLATGLATRRGLIVGAVIMVFGMTQIGRDAARLPWSEIGLLTGLVATGMVMGRRVETQVPRGPALSSSEGIWMCITVEAGCPPSAAGRSEPMPVDPLDDPERRSLHRRKNRRRELATAGSD